MRVLVADDQPQVRSALQILLNQEPDVNVVSEASDAKSLLTQIQTSQPEIILLDWDLPGLPLSNLLSVLQINYPSLVVIVLSGKLEARQQALAAGADAFVSKIDPPTQLLAVLHALNSGKQMA
jgi:DNA-binding NarL/FixJ family response regulator